MRQRQLWTPEEDKVLKYLRDQQEIKKWSVISKMMMDQYNMPDRTGKQCRQRYFNHLDSQIKRGEWSQQEEMILWKMHSQNGNRWTLMANRLKGRSQNCIKNHFYSKIRKAVRKINKCIVDRYKTQYKQIKTSVLYKFLQLAEDKFRSGKSSDIQTIDMATNIKNRLFLFQSQTSEKNKLIQITKGLIINMHRLQQRLKKQSKQDRNSSGFLDPRSCRLRGSSRSIHSYESQDNDNSSFYSSSCNTSLQPSDEDEPQMDALEQLLIEETNSLGIRHQCQMQRSVPKELKGSLGAQVLTNFRSHPLSKSQKCQDNFHITEQDKVFGIQVTGVAQTISPFQICVSQTNKYRQFQDDFNFQDQKFICDRHNKQERQYNYFQQPSLGFHEFQFRVFSPKVPSEDYEIEQERI